MLKLKSNPVSNQLYLIFLVLDDEPPAPISFASIRLYFGTKSELAYEVLRFPSLPVLGISIVSLGTFVPSDKIVPSGTVFPKPYFIYLS